MLGIEILYLLPLISAWHAWDGLTLFFPQLATWTPLWLFGRFCLEEFLTVYWCEILDELFIDTPAYGKYLMQHLKNQDGKVRPNINVVRSLIWQTESSRLPVDRTYFNLAVGRWILCRFVSVQIGSYIQKLGMLILCWDVTGLCGTWT